MIETWDIDYTDQEESGYEFDFSNVRLFFSTSKKSTTFPALSQEDAFIKFSTFGEAFEKLRFIECDVNVYGDSYTLEIEKIPPYTSTNIEFRFADPEGEGAFIVNNDVEIVNTIYNKSIKSIKKLYDKRKWTLAINEKLSENIPNIQCRIISAFVFTKNSEDKLSLLTNDDITSTLINRIASVQISVLVKKTLYFLIYDCQSCEIERILNNKNEVVFPEGDAIAKIATESIIDILKTGQILPFDLM